MKQTLLALSIFFVLSASAQTKDPEREFKLKLPSTKLIQVINAISTTETLSAKDANTLIIEIQRQANDSTLNPLPKIIADKPKDLKPKN
jgi:hypothetical protein